MPYLLAFIIVVLAALLQTLSGFGFALMVMPLLTLLWGLGTAAPLVALLGLTLYSINWWRYRQAVNRRELGGLLIGAAIGVPLGLTAVTLVPETLIRVCLGVLLVGYAVYALAAPAFTAVLSSRWRYGAGFLAGCLGGAYNVPGPPVIFYGSVSQWPKNEFRATLQSLFWFQGVLVVLGHGITQHITTAVLTTGLILIPALLLGIVAGARLDARVNKERFRTLVAVMIFFAGLSLLL